jgi:hypothetical protein
MAVEQAVPSIFRCLIKSDLENDSVPKQYPLGRGWGVHRASLDAEFKRKFFCLQLGIERWLSTL